MFEAVEGMREEHAELERRFGFPWREAYGSSESGPALAMPEEFGYEFVGTGAIGSVAARILTGFGCRVIAADPHPDAACETIGVRYLTIDELFASSDIITLHCPLTPATRHLVDATAIERMKAGVMLINTSRGAIVDTRAIIDALKIGQLGGLGIDVYEEEADLFFEDHSSTPIGDDIFARLLTFPNVVITGHQGFFTVEALTAIAETTIANISAFERDGRPLHEVTTASS